MKKPIFLLSVLVLFACLLTVSAFAADTVYLDGTTYSTLADAVAAVDDGGTVILTTNYATPTGAALLKHFATGFGPMPLMRLEKTGYGMGKKDFGDRANCVRAMIGEA